MALKDKIAGFGGSVRDKAANAADGVRSVKPVDGAVELGGSLFGAFKHVILNTFSKDYASKGVGGVKFAGRAMGSVVSAIGSMANVALRGLASIASRHPYIAVAGTVFLGGAFAKSWMNDRAAKKQVQEAQDMAPSASPYMNSVQSPEALSPHTQQRSFVEQHAPNGPAAPGQRPVVGAEHGQRF